MADKISDKAINLIIDFEVSGRSYYEKHYRKPEWPGGSSGITIGIGYDLGYANEKKINADWTGKIPGPMIQSLIRFSGYTGSAASEKLGAAKKLIDIPWQAAYDVFMNRDIPEWIRTVQTALPNTSLLSEDSFGALVSLAYNRGASFSKIGDRYTEMNDIKRYMISKEFDKIPDCFRRMKRLWPNAAGLRDRRDREALLFQQGLK